MASVRKLPLVTVLAHYKRLCLYLILTIATLLGLTSFMHHSLAEKTYLQDENILKNSYNDKTLSSSVKFVNATRVVLVNTNRQNVLLDNSQDGDVLHSRIIPINKNIQILTQYTPQSAMGLGIDVYVIGYILIGLVVFLYIGLIIHLSRLYHYPIEGLADALHSLVHKEPYHFKNPYQGVIGRLQKGIELVSHEITVKDHALSRQISKWQDALSEARYQFSQARLSKDKLRQELMVRQIFEKKLNSSKDYLMQVLDAIPGMLLGLDHSLKVCQWNKAMSSFTAVSRSQAIGKRLDSVFPSIYELIGPSQNLHDFHGHFERSRVLFKTLDERKVFLKINLYALSDDGSAGIVILIEDITTQCRLEDIMVQTEKMMSVGGLAAGMAHEINNPLGGILQSSQNIQRRVDPTNSVNAQKAKEIGTTIDQIYVYLEKREIINFIKGIRELSERAAIIVQNMLEFSRASDDKFVASDLAELINRAVEIATGDYDLKKNYDFKRVEIYRQFEENLPLVYCSPPAIEQVVLNLVKNAAQAMIFNPHKGVDEHFTITLRTFKQDEYAVIEIEDNGPGMPEHIKERIFEPFFTTKEVGIGTGLGLSVSNFIIKTKHHGDMNVRSQKGEGTTFIIKLPFNYSKNH